MSYEKIGFVSGQKLKADHLNHIETGIKNFETSLEDKVSKNNITLEKHTDNLVYIFVDGTPVGSGLKLGSIVDGDIIGTLDADNNILISGALPNGVYALKFEQTDGTYIDAGSLTVGDIEPVKTNFADPTSSDWIVGGRISNGSETGIAMDASEAHTTQYIPVQTGDILKISGYTKINWRYAVYSTTSHAGRLFNNAVPTSADGYINPITVDEFEIINDSIKYFRITVTPSGADASKVVINIKRNGVWL